MSVGKIPFSYAFSNTSLITRFAVHSFICIGIMTAALWFLVSNYLINEMLAREWESTARVVRADVRQWLTDDDFKSKDPQRVGDKFDALLQRISLVADVLRLKVYDTSGTVIWSDDERLVGQSFPDNDDLRKALRGSIVADISSLNKTENVFDQNSFDRAVEIYVPVYTKDNRELLGVLETYKYADRVYADIRRARMVVLIGAFGGGLLLYVSLFAIVRQAARKIDEQQQNLIKIQSELVTSQRMAAIGEMAAAVAHGIGNPLSSIRAAAQVATLNCRTENGSLKKIQSNLESIMQQVDRVQKRMQGLLNFAKPMEPRPGPVEVNSLVKDVVSTLRPRFEEAHVQSELDLDGRLPKPTLDPNQIEQVFMGVITNALEATPRGGRVTVRTKLHNANPRAVSISIEDTGEGIPAQYREGVFEPFFTTKFRGTGIGLPLAKKFVEKNGGTIAISDARSGGTRVDIKFPLNGAN
jgi:two-component system, NtrC family, sensor histidine kinase HydH